MPRNITLTFDDGSSHVYENAPDEVTPEQITARAEKEFAGKTITALDGGRKAEKPAENEARRTGIKPVERLRGPHEMAASAQFEPKMSGPSLGEIGTGIAETGGNMLAGMIAQPIAGLRGIGSMAGDLKAIATGEKTFDQSANEAADKIKGVQQKTAGVVPQNAVAQGIQGAVAKPFEMANHALGAAGGAIGGALGGEKGRIAGETLGDNAIDLAGAVIPALKVGKALVKGAKGMPVPPQTQKLEALKEAQDNGFLVPNTKASPGVTNSVMEGAADPSRLHDRMAMKNSSHVDALTRKDIGMKAGDKLDRPALEAYRNKEGQKYDSVKSVPGTVTIDPQFVSDLDAITQEFESIKNTTPGLHKHQEVDLIKSELLNPAQPYTAKTIIEIARSLRSQASKDLKGNSLTAEQVDAAMARKAASEHLEALLERHLDAQGMKTLSLDFKEARAKIAKSHNIEDALNDVTGEVDPQKLRVMYDKKIPLSDNLLKIARAAKASPETMKPNVNLKGDLMPHVGDWGAAGAASLAFSNPWGLLAAAVRPAARGLAATPTYQRVMGKVKDPKAQRPALQAKTVLPGMATGLGPQESTLPEQKK